MDEQLITYIESTMKKGIDLYRIQSFEMHFSHVFYVNVIINIFALNDSRDRYEMLNQHLSQLNNAEQKLLQYVFKKAEDRKKSTGVH
jgi:hypothetical protein